LAELKISSLHSGYEDLEVLHGVSIRAESAKITCIIGPNGSGKSTLANSIVGLVKVTSGKIEVDGLEITGRAPYNIIKFGISKLSQGSTVFPQMTVGENLSMGAYTLKEKIEINERLQTIYEMFPVLKSKTRALGGNLSGGEQVMLSIARILMSKPRITIFDEPSLGLSPKYVDIVYDKIREIRDSGITVLLVEQNVRKALSVSDYAYVLELGENKTEGAGSELAGKENLFDVYVGADRHSETL